MRNKKDEQKINAEQYAIKLLVKLVWETFLIEADNTDGNEK